MPEHFCGHLDIQCVFCEALHFRREPQKCCANGKVSLAELPDAPPFLKWLLTSQHKIARDFRDNINAYNTLLSFASRSYRSIIQPGKYMHLVNKISGGIQIAKQQGSTFHTPSPLMPAVRQDGTETQPLFGNIFLHDPKTAAQLRMDNKKVSKYCESWVS